MKSRRTRNGRAFTLVELLVVITIIGILAGLLLVGANAALKKAKQTQIKLEIDNIDLALKELKNQTDAFPPNAAWLGGGYMYSPNEDSIKADLVRYLKKAFPRIQEPLTQQNDRGIVDQLVRLANTGSSSRPSGMNGAEAIVFWLGGFSKDARFPISGKGGPSFKIAPSVEIESLEERQFTYEFDLSRLGPRNADGNFSGRFIQYDVNLPGVGVQTRRVNLWTYTPAKSKVPLTYFDTSRYKPNQYDVPYYAIGGGDGILYPIKQRSASGANTAVFANAKSFQIIHPGIDDEWGDFTPFSMGQIAKNTGVIYPDGPFTEAIADTLVNFSSNSLEDSEK